MVAIMEQFMIVLNQLIKFLILILVGMGAVKWHVLDEKGLQGVSRLIVKIILPVFIFTNTITGATRTELLESWIAIPLSALLYAMWMVTGFLLRKLFQKTGDRGNILQAVFSFSNVGFIGIPLISELFPEKGMIYMALFTIVDQLILWTYGAALTTTQTEKAGGWQLKNLKKLISPALVAIVAGIIVVLFQIQLPAVLLNTCQSIGAASSPLSLIYIGGALYLSDLKAILKCKEIYAGIFAKMLILPLVVFALFYRVFHVPYEMAYTFTVLTAVPSMTTIAMLAKANSTEGDYCVGAVMMTTVLCVVTLPIVSYLMTFL